MAFYWLWENVSPVRRLRDEYDELLDDLDYDIKNKEQGLVNIKAIIKAATKTLDDYTEAKGDVADLYYKKMNNNKQEYKKIINECEEALSSLRGKRKKAQSIRNELQYYYDIEKEEDKEFTLGEIGYE